MSGNFMVDPSSQPGLMSFTWGGAAVEMQLKLRDGLRVERVGDEAVVLGRSGELHRITGAGVQALDLIEAGVEPRDVPADLAEAVDDLVAAGLVADPRGWTRRRMLMAGGATLAAATVVTFSLADPAAAQGSGCPPGTTPTDPDASGEKYQTVGTSQYVTRPGQTTVLVRAWAGGGGGGGSDYTGAHYPGGGGGGGAYATATVNVTACEEYDVIVGAGGAKGAGGGSNGSPGGVSLFDNGSQVSAQPGSGGAGGAAFGAGSGGGTGGSAGSSVGSTKNSGGRGGHRGSTTQGGGGGGGGASDGGPR